MTTEEPRVIAKLYKVPIALGDYTLRGTLDDGRLVEICANQAKRTTTDPDFFVVVVPKSEVAAP